MKLPFFGGDDEDDEDDEYGVEEDQGESLLARIGANLSPVRLLRWRPGGALNANDRPAQAPEPPPLEGLTAVPLPDDGRLLSAGGGEPESPAGTGEPEAPAGAAPASSDRAPGGEGADGALDGSSGDLSGDPLGEPAGPSSASPGEAPPSAAGGKDNDDEDDDDEDKGDAGDSPLDGLMDLFEDSDDANVDIRELARSLEELDIRELARQCQEVAQELKQQRPAA